MGPVGDFLECRFGGPMVTPLITRFSGPHFTCMHMALRPEAGGPGVTREFFQAEGRRDKNRRTR